MYEVGKFLALLNNRELELDTELAEETKDYIVEKFSVDVSKADVITGWRADDSYFTFARNFVRSKKGFKFKSQARGERNVPSGTGGSVGGAAKNLAVLRTAPKGY